MNAPHAEREPLKLLIVVDCYLPSEKSAARLIADLAQEFVRQGHLVTILVPSDAVSGVRVEDEAPGIQIIRYRVGKTKGAHYAIRAINEMSLSLAAWLRCRRILLRQPHDLIVFYSPSIFFGPLVMWLKRRWQSKAFLILRDIFPDWAVDTGILRKGLLYRVFKAFEQLQYRAADVIGVETRGSTRYFEGGPHQHKVEVLRNWTVPQLVPQNAGAFREELGLANKVVYFYGGNIGVAQDMDNVIRLAKRMLPLEDVHFLLVGSGNRFDSLKSLIETENILNMTLLSAVDQAAYLAMLSEFDVGLITLDARLKSCNYPGKLLGYLQCGMPVLASINPGNDLAELLQEREIGLVSINGDDDHFYENALRLRDFELRERMGERAMNVLREVFSVEHVANQLLRPVRTPQVPGLKQVTGVGGTTPET